MLTQLLIIFCQFLEQVNVDTLTREPGGSQSIWYPGHVALPEGSEEVVYLAVGDQIPPLPQLVLKLAVRGEEDDPGEEKAWAHGHSTPLQMAA